MIAVLMRSSSVTSQVGLYDRDRGQSCGCIGKNELLSRETYSHGAKCGGRANIF